MSRLDTLIKLHRWQLNEKRRRVVELETLAAGTRRRLDMLAAELAAEVRLSEASEMARRAFPAYAEAARERRRNLSQTLVTITGELAEAQAAVAEAFQELKKYELAQEARLRRDRDERGRRDRIALDEIALQTHRRSAAHSGA